MRLMTITVCALLSALSVSCSVTPIEVELSDRDDGMDPELAGAAPAPVPKGTCSCNPAPDSTNGWVFAKNADGTLKQNCGRCTSSSLCSTGSCTYVNSVGSEKDVGCQWSSTLPEPTDPEPTDPTEPAPVEPLD